MYPTRGSVIFKLLRTLISALVLVAIAGLCAFVVFNLSGLPFVGTIVKFVMPFVWGIIGFYAILWVLIWFSYRDFQWASKLCEAKESYDLGRYRKAVDYASFALNYKKKCGLSYYLRSRAYEHCEIGGLPRSDMDMAQSLGINPDNFDF